MMELGLFKKSFFLGRLVWVRGFGPRKNVRVVLETLSSCQVKESEVLILKPMQFIDFVQSGLDRELILNYEVFLIQEFENLSGDLAQKFLKCIGVFRSLQMGLGIRLVLVSEQEVTSELDEFSIFKPVIVKIIHYDQNPGDLNERVHALMDQAMEITSKPVHRISEKAAAFLETCFLDESDEDILALLVLGLMRSDGRVLRFRNFIPPVKHNGDPDGALETICN
jgi:hypothetical protein